MDSDMVEIAPPAFAWPAVKVAFFICSLHISVESICLSEGVFVKYKSKSMDQGFDDQPAAKQGGLETYPLTPRSSLQSIFFMAALIMVEARLSSCS
ncbi:hypothetical protein F2Q70_00042778 [Brassica cretica]|uniref:Uncharacterized protein n=1 Tax=Brassica cretica TaxID=69181 RepID=A0A8S9KJ77_BRACR|nr:hypothetical protein F2Q70_00042778 [Brassica cretica]